MKKDSKLNFIEKVKENTHNKRRPHITEKDSFTKIIQNMEYFFSKYDNKSISLRINILAIS